MKVIKSFGHGIKKASSEGRMLLLLWIFNLLFASLIYFLFSNFLSRIFATSAGAENFLKAFDFNAFLEALIYNGAALGQIVSTAMFLTLAYGVFSVFLSGGILHTLFEGHASRKDAKNLIDRRRLAPQYFLGAGRFFGRFFRLFLYSLVLWTGAITALLTLMAIIGAATQNTANEALMFWLYAGAAAIGLFLAVLIMMIVDYARIGIVVENKRAVLGSLLRAISFVFRRLGKTLVLYALFLLTGAAVMAAYWAANSGIGTHSTRPVLAAFLIGQVFILARGWVKIGLQAGQMDLFRAAASLAKPAPAMEIEPPALDPLPPQKEEPPKADWEPEIR